MCTCNSIQRVDLSLPAELPQVVDHMSRERCGFNSIWSISFFFQKWLPYASCVVLHHLCSLQGLGIHVQTDLAAKDSCKLIYTIVEAPKQQIVTSFVLVYTSVA